MMKSVIVTCLTFLLWTGMSGNLFADALTVASYDMLNGSGTANGGTFNYWDLNYSGSGATNMDGAPLTGGTGDLTDGVIPTQNWFDVENSAGTGPYVGWVSSFTPNPLVTFRFPTLVAVDSVTIYVDDSNGTGGVSPPASVDIGLESGSLVNFATPDPVGSLPTSYTFSGLGLSGSAIDVRFNYSDQWVFVSEVTFDGSIIPEPNSGALVVCAIGAVAMFRRKAVQRFVPWIRKNSQNSST